MSLYCSTEVFEALDGVLLPATKDDLLDYAELKDAREAVIILLNQLGDDRIFRDISEICENARMACNSLTVRSLRSAAFPASRDGLLEFADRNDVPPPVREAIESLPHGYTFSDMDEVCGYIL